MREDERPNKPTPHDIAEMLNAPDEYLWAVRRKIAWGVVVVFLLLATLAAAAAVGYIGGRQFYVFGGLGARQTSEIKQYFAAYSRTGITLAQSAPAVPQDWPVKLGEGVQRCWQAPECQASLTGSQWIAWKTYAGKWFPQLAQAVTALQVFAGALLMAFCIYLFTWADVADWKRWEQRERLAAGKTQRDRRRRGG